MLVYGKGSGARVEANNPSVTVNGFGVTASNSNTNNFGWTAGAGVERAFAVIGQRESNTTTLGRKIRA